MSSASTSSGAKGDKDATGDGKPQVNPTPSRNRHEQHAFPPRIVLLVFLVGLLLASIFLQRRRDLPANYALCSKEGKVYTVDESNPQTECIVVHGNKIVDWGKISKQKFQADMLEWRGADVSSTGEIRKRWGEKDRTGPVSSILPGAKNGLKFVYTDDKHIIVPGLTGSLLPLCVSG